MSPISLQPRCPLSPISLQPRCPFTSGNDCGGGGGGRGAVRGQDSTEPEVIEPEVSTDSAASACSGYGPCDRRKTIQKLY